MEVGSDGDLDLSREYHKKLFGPLFVFMVELSFKVLLHILRPLLDALASLCNTIGHLYSPVFTKWDLKD